MIRFKKTIFFLILFSMIVKDLSRVVLFWNKHVYSIFSIDIAFSHRFLYLFFNFASSLNSLIANRAH